MIEFAVQKWTKQLEQMGYHRRFIWNPMNERMFEAVLSMTVALSSKYLTLLLFCTAFS